MASQTLVALLLLALLGQASGDLKQAAMRGRLDLIAEELGASAATDTHPPRAPPHARVPLSPHVVGPDAGSDINARGTGSPDGTALLAAVLAAKAESVRELLARGADPELPNRDGMTPLHAAAFQNQRDVIEALIEGGATVEARPAPISRVPRCSSAHVHLRRNSAPTATACCAGRPGAQARRLWMRCSTYWSSWTWTHGRCVWPC